MAPAESRGFSGVVTLAATLAVLGCGSSDDSSPAAADAVDLGGEATALSSHGETPTSLSKAKAVTELFVEEDPTIDPSKTAGENADAVAARLASATSTCASVKVTHATGTATVAVDFGSGCSIGSLGTVSGAVAASVSKAGSAITLAFTFTGVQVSGLSLSGTLNATTSNGTSYATIADLTTNGNHVTFNGTLALDSGATGVTIDGSGTSQGGSQGPLTYTATAVHQAFGSCYADAGTLAVQKTTVSKRGKTVTVTETMTFASTTPATGQVTLTIEGQTTTMTLPTYGKCPPA